MRISAIVLLLLGWLLPGLSHAQVSLETKADSLSYALGLDVAKNLGNFDFDFNYEMIYQGFKGAQEENGGILTLEQSQALLQAFQQEMMAAQQAKMAERAQQAQVEGEIFLEENGKKDGIITTASGLQYEVLREGDGVSPTPNNTVKVHYEGKLLNDEVFDSSYERGTPTEFMVGRVIQGWIEGLQLMKTGAHYRFFIPSNLAYGPNGSPPNIGPNEVLIFEVELFEVK